MGPHDAPFPPSNGLPNDNPMDEDGDDDNAAHDKSSTHSADKDGHEISATEKLACDRCRQRKVRCNRVNPCLHCARTGSVCSYTLGPKPREKRQRVLISSAYESRMDSISRKLDELNELMSQLSHTQGSQVPLPPSSSSLACSVTYPSSALAGVSVGSSPASTPGPPVHSGDGKDNKDNDNTKTQFEGESPLFSHAIFATKFLQDAIVNNPSAKISLEMSSVLDNLRAAVDVQKQQPGTPDRLFPLARRIPRGTSIRDLPMPPIEKALACLRMAKECPRVEFFCLVELESIGQFTEYFVKVYSPGAVSDADLIIVHAGLYWLFCECSCVTAAEEAKQDLEAQALLCRENLETVLSMLPFHIPPTLDYAYAMSMASNYALQRCNFSLAWNFICSASRLSYSLGLHGGIPTNHESPDTSRRRARLFWTIYATDKMLSLRLGQPSTIRDSEIALPPMSQAQATESIPHILLPSLLKLSGLQGRVYDEIYSPGALNQPQEVQIFRATALGDELKRIMYTDDKLKYYEERRRVVGDVLHELLWHSDRLSQLSLLTLIYRGIPPAKPSGSAFCEECVATAREALKEHERCLNIITSKNMQSIFLELYVNWGLLQAPFTPFIVLFCRIIETSDPSDLGCLGALVDTLQMVSTSTSISSHYPTCTKQVRLFKALYDVAVKYIEVRTSAARGDMLESSDMDLNTYMNTMGMGVLQPSPLPSSASGSLDMADSAGSAVGGMSGNGTNVMASAQNQIFGTFGMEMDPSGAELGNWFYQNHQMMRMLEDT
ncbi:fungal-specific transcription factor domain-containing protein [Durotheca rogersii]|uniref:fungal-specific transcription factor domain-containing protein n=1 Tax=Durotheca rogersii TaxID=419775 RepID=UPI002220CC9B|nr:fungal-specific transcription factor domain-containing protein [Durotheca rogersii]KAI5861123.1 fungal-specific transcription factor domain-containing protein [Durotheca rogersii]